MFGGERGIRTLDRGLTYTPLAGERLQPLGHLSGAAHCNVKVLVVVDEIWVLSGDLCGKFSRLLFLVPPLARQPVRTFLDNRVIDGR